MTTPSLEQARDIPVRIRKSDLKDRYAITERLAADWIRQAVADGAAVKRGRYIFARPSQLDAWVLSDGKLARRSGR